MSIVGFNFTKISAGKDMGAKGQISINNNITIGNIEKANIGISGGKSAVKITFKFITSYNPKIGTIELEGSTVVMLEEKQIERVLAGWKENKSLPPESAASILNYMLEKCNIQSLILAKDIGLPSPIRLPRVEVNKAVEVTKGKKAPAKKTTAKKSTSKKK